MKRQSTLLYSALQWWAHTHSPCLASPGYLFSHALAKVVLLTAAGHRLLLGPAAPGRTPIPPAPFTLQFPEAIGADEAEGEHQDGQGKLTGSPEGRGVGRG